MTEAGYFAFALIFIVGVALGVFIGDLFSEEPENGESTLEEFFCDTFLPEKKGDLQKTEFINNEDEEDGSN